MSVVKCSADECISQESVVTKKKLIRWLTTISKFTIATEKVAISALSLGFVSTAPKWPKMLILMKYFSVNVLNNMSTFPFYYLVLSIDQVIPVPIQSWPFHSVFVPF